MTAPPSDRVKVRTDGLAAFYAALAKVLTEAGLTGAQLNDVFTRSVSAECVQCGLPITGEEIGQLALADPQAELANPKLKRLRLGYCGGPGCNSYFYTVKLAAHPDVNWATVIAKVESQTAPVEHLPSEVSELTLPPTKKRTVLVRVAVGVVIILVLLLIRHLMTGGTIPLIHHAPKYQVDPSSVSGDAAE